MDLALASHSGTGGLAAMEMDQIDYLLMLPEESWLRIFGYLLRNDIDNCGRACKTWREMIRRNGKYIPSRVIEYLILSSRRIFSITACSGNHIKVYTFRKYFNHKTVQYNINDPANMKVTTIHREADGSNDALFKYSPATVARSSPGTNLENGLCPPELFGLIDRPLEYKLRSKFKLGTAPLSYFYKLRDLLRDTSLIKQLVLQYCTINDAFVEKFVKTTPMPLMVGSLHQHFTKTEFRNHAYYGIFTDKMVKVSDEEVKKRTQELIDQVAQQVAQQP